MDGERDAGYWNDLIITRRAGKLRGALWRTHADRVNADLCRAWWPADRPRRVLKTDLFDEASGVGLWPVLTEGAATVVGIDRAAETVGFARAAQPETKAAASDVRHLPFRDSVFDLVVSNSTLDHFARVESIAQSLGELARVLRPGGRLILTLDNPGNPVVALRNALPFQWLNRLGVVPYFVGATAGRVSGRRLLEQAGFSVRATGAVLHCPRAVAVAAASLLDLAGWTRAGRGLLALLHAFEVLGRWPTRFGTGYYVAFLAEKPS